MEFIPNEQQVHGVYAMENWWRSSNDLVFELAGRAGTGKTTLIKYFIDRIGLDMDDVVFLAFMGKAACQMQRNGLPAQTIHSFIYKLVKEVVRNEKGEIQVDSKGKPLTKLTFRLRDKSELPKIPLLFILDEAGTVSEEMGNDLCSYGIPIIALGDLCQLPPVFGRPFFMNHPNVELTKIMRQAENDPIVWLANQILEGNRLSPGIYGNSAVINKSDLTEYQMNEADVILTGTNRLRHEINTLFRTTIRPVKRFEIPEVGEKIVCRKNNWSRSINDSIYLTNGMCGTLEYIDMSSLTKNKSVLIDFKPDFLKHKMFKNVKMDYEHLFSDPALNRGNELDAAKRKRDRIDKFEFAYALTVHLSQGSQYPNVLYLNELYGTETFRKQMQYTAITRAEKRITIVQ